MIHELTAEQTALLPAIRDRWLRVCLSTEPADRPAAEVALAGAYASAGLPAPTSVVWMESPLAGRIQAAAMAVGRERQRRTVDVVMPSGACCSSASQRRAASLCPAWTAEALCWPSSGKRRRARSSSA